MAIGVTTANNSPYLVNDANDQEGTVMTTVTPKVVMMREVHKMMTTNELTTMTSMKDLSFLWMHQGQELWMPSIRPTFGGLSMRM